MTFEVYLDPCPKPPSAVPTHAALHYGDDVVIAIARRWWLPFRRVHFDPIVGRGCCIFEYADLGETNLGVELKLGRMTKLDYHSN